MKQIREEKRVLSGFKNVEEAIIKIANGLINESMDMQQGLLDRYTSGDEFKVSESDFLRVANMIDNAMQKLDTLNNAVSLMKDVVLNK